ncbi:MAG TPA: ice-binding family protein [Acidimicrobiia bacterium]|nr:ice-binding family protein [Acidimicrobiia bacterium]
MTHSSVPQRLGTTTLIALTTTALLLVGGVATAAIVPTVLLGTSANYSVLGGSTVTNTGPSTLNASLGLSPGTSITGFPPGTVGGTIDNANGAAGQAQIDLTAAYVDAAGRVLNGTTTADLGNLVLVGGVYAGPGKGALSLTGNLTLDGAGDPNSVFIFQTDSTLTTASGSSVTLINGAQQCNVFWQVGSSATLGTSSVFAGNILALTSITVTTGVTVQGRALARNGAVTLDTNTFLAPTCDLSVPTTTSSTTTTVPGATTTAVGATTTAVGATTAATGLPFTGLPMGTTLLAAFSSLVLGAILIRRSKALKD